MTSLLPLLILTARIYCVESTNQLEWRLPTVLHPFKYTIHLNVTEETLMGPDHRFCGLVIIDVKAKEETSEIKLHASSHYLLLHNVTVDEADISKEDYSIDEITDILKISLQKSILPEFNTTITISFSGLLSTTDLLGFYRSSYVLKSGETRYLGTTKFESYFARRAFPCFDEPAFRASFEVHITYPVGYNALSNMPGTLESHDSKSETMHFQPTASMSTYLLAYVISDFTCTQGKSIGTVPYRVCSKRESEHMRHWALEIGPKLLSRLNDYTQFDFSISKPKLDQISIPDFPSGAAEHWGLIAYREYVLLWEPDDSSTYFQTEVARTIAHELSHNWFGNLVTCPWWSVLFMKEGFARFFERYIVAEVFPSWESDKTYVLDVLQKALERDTKLSKLPLQFEVNTPQEVEDRYDVISYDKGSAIFRMVMYVMGYESFRHGLNLYFNRFKYSAATPEDLWEILDEKIDDKTIKLPAKSLLEIMDNWVNRRGYPLITVKVTGSKITLEQKVYLTYMGHKSKWYVPICVLTPDEINQHNCTGSHVWLTPKEELVLNYENGVPKWLIINNLIGYFRVQYGITGWRNIGDALREKNFSGIRDIQRAMLVDDIFSLGRYDKLPYEEIFSIIRFLENDTSYFPWAPATQYLIPLLKKVDGSSTFGINLMSYCSNLVRNVYNSVSFGVEDDVIPSRKQVMILKAACKFGIAECIQSCRDHFQKYFLEGLKPPKNIREIIYCVVLEHSNGATEWYFLWDAYNSSTIPAEKKMLSSVLACTENKTLLDEYLQLSLDKKNKLQERSLIFEAVYERNLDVALVFFVRNFDAVAEMYLGQGRLQRMLKDLASRITTDEEYETFKEILRSLKFRREMYSQWTLNTLEGVKSNIEGTQRSKQGVIKYFSKNTRMNGATQIFKCKTYIALLILFYYFNT